MCAIVFDRDGGNRINGMRLVGEESDGGCSLEGWLAASPERANQ